ncbi:hypothetical protein [Mucilaginibacter paludis]|uniref:Uncharacterized protein n=1 Tax=Mucilaginibacter paludis DSM 18603 TaxID=714943 RepID=H1XZ73_9SPHI|nr:hypothetical protein [Mucilaginibacter paludis]EHQ24658.1 hypothetical protein Mucpa_0464 [Mucilaginibacter paludis DSM 18603]
MKTTVIGSAKAKNNSEVKNNIRPSVTGKEAKNNEADKDKAPAQTPQVEENQAPETKAGNGVTMDNQPADTIATPKGGEVKQAEPTKKEIKEQIIARPVFNLDTTVKLIGDLSKKITQRDKLRATIDNLDTFTIASNEDGDVTDSNKFYRCELVLHDDDGNEFVTKNAYIIEHVAQYVNSLCVEKLAEIEAEIVIPV